MKLAHVPTSLQILATCLMGLMAGFFFAFSVDAAPAIAAAYLLGVFVLTREINIPINNALALWDPQSPPAAWQQARDDWNLANLIRCLAACASFAAALCTLVYRRQNMVS